MDLKAIERKWQQKWREAGTFESEPIPGKKKYFVNFPYPYMNGYLHIGHAFSLMRIEILARYKRMTGHNVLFPFAFHCTGTPIVAAADRIRKGEAGQIKILRDMGIPEEDIPKFEDSLYWTQFFPKNARSDLDTLGIAVDWRRSFITTSLNPFYSRFIEWQFTRLREEGLITKGEYPVIWCTNDNAPTGDHARLTGEGERPQEYTLLKFRTDFRPSAGEYSEFGGNVYLLAATLRPETVFGQTNLWVDPEGRYTLAEYRPGEGGGVGEGQGEGQGAGKGKAEGQGEGKADGELWILSDPALIKLREQKKDLTSIGSVSGSDLIGHHGLAPAIHRQIPILPSHFCDPDKGTGIVTSVPSDAPDDWMGIHDLQNDPEECRKFGLDPGAIQKIEPIPIIESSEWGTNSAVKLCQSMGIKNQFERGKLEQAKREIYKHGFYSGVLTDECGEFSGKSVEWVKDEVKAILIKDGEADIMYEPSGEVICRCLTKCLVKIVDNQWFISYSDAEWKRKVHDAVEGMEFFPEAVRKQFDYVIDWLNDWACTREFGLGTLLPWDRKWLIESLSDSTIYMAYYTISNYLENGAVRDPEALDYDFFDYIYRGNGDPTVIANRCGIDVPKLDEMRDEFLYWYPYEIRGSGKDLVQNHLAFCIFNHVAVFDEGFAPRGYTVNGWMKVGGEKMSKSAGNFYTLREVMDTYGTDVVRLTLGQAGEGLEDPNWELEFADNAGKRLAQWAEFAMDNYSQRVVDNGHQRSDREHHDSHAELNEAGGDHHEKSKEQNEAGSHHQGEGREYHEVDRWFRSKLNRLVRETAGHMEMMNFRSAVKSGYFDLQNAFRRYQKRKLGDPHPLLLNRFIEIQTLLLAPYVPHLAEEIWERIGKTGFIVDAQYPKAVDEHISEEVERQEDYLSQTVEDIRKILKVTKMQPTKMVLYTSPGWKYAVMRSVVENGDFNVGTLMKSVMQDPELRRYGKEVNKYIVQLVKDRPTYAPTFDEFGVLCENIDYLSREFECEVEVYQAEDEGRYDPQRKAGVAKPYKPGIFIE